MVGPTPDELRQWDRTAVWHAFTQMAEYSPLIIERAEGCTLFDLDGRALLDGASSLWCNIHGHRHPQIDQAIRDQLDRVAHVTSLGCSNPTTIELAKRLVDLAPGELNHVFFSGDGASAVEVALKMAFQHWQQCDDARPAKTSYMAFSDAYHGDTLGAVSVGGVERFHAMFRPLLFDVIRLPQPNPRRLPAGVPESAACAYYLEAVEAALREHHEQTAAVVIEPLVQAAAGMIMHPPGFLRGLRELTERYNVLLIADEVAVGMGRTGSLFACQQEEVVPDLLCLAKGLTGGYLALSATLASDTIWQSFLGTYASSRTFFHGHTYGGNPLAAAAGLATLDIFEQEQTLLQMPEKVARMGEHLARWSRHPHVGDVRQRGLIGAVELVKDRETGKPFPWTERKGQQVCDRAIEEGVWIRPLGNVVVLMPPLGISIAELDQLCAAVQKGLETLSSSPWPSDDAADS